MNNIYVDVDYYASSKYGEQISGDVFLISRNREKHQIVCTLSDGLGSGVKANVLASLTAHMAHKMSFSPIDLVHSAEILMNTLPPCKERNISYSTFTIADIRFTNVSDNYVRLVEYDNPKALLFREDRQTSIIRSVLELNRKQAFKKEIVTEADIVLGLNDRIVIFTDGVSQAGLSEKRPMGFTSEGIAKFVKSQIQTNRDISSRALAKSIIQQALSLENNMAKDDMTVFVIHSRKPRCTLVVTGPPYTEDGDELLCKKIKEFDGKCIIAGGTTSKIVSRVLSRPLKVDMSSFSKDIPPSSTMEGIDLVTEGMITLNAVAKVLEEKQSITSLEDNAVKRFARLLLDSDRVHFVVGTKINEAYQDPSLPMELGIRRTVVNRIRQALEQNFIKETTLEYL